jgi:2-amino-4-hydroxy-6-hydroxymethyldihydropteridine diphosphokinase
VKEKLHTVYLSLGSNIGNKEENINRVIRNINERMGSVTAVSAFYITKPVGFESANDFVNAACEVQTALAPLEVLELTQVIEREIGRKKKSVNGSYSDRLIDIDILLYDNEIVEYPHLVIPHEHMHERDFVLKPLADIAGEVIHPVLLKSIEELKNDLDHSSDSTASTS